MELEEKRAFPVPALAGAGILLLLVGGYVFLMRQGPPSGPAAPLRLPFGPAESEYSLQIQISGLKMSRATNLLNQELTFVQGVVKNGGARSVRDVEFTVEFRDVLNQVVLREAQRPLGPAGSPHQALPAGGSREFQLTFEHVPADWNRQYPTIKVTGLLLE